MKSRRALLDFYRLSSFHVTISHREPEFCTFLMHVLMYKVQVQTYNFFVVTML